MVQTYYLYILADTGRIQLRRDLEASDDEAAIAQAQRLSDGRAMELWSGARKVWACEAQPPEG